MRYHIWRIQKGGLSENDALVDPLCSSEAITFPIRAFLQRARSGILRRLIGHSWASFYHARQPNSSEINLMRDAGIPFECN